MDDSSTFEWLLKAIGQATRSAKFCVVGRLPNIDPGLDVEGLGEITVPLKRLMAKTLIAACQVAPYGKGSQTLVDKKVRNTFELDPKKFTLSEAWTEAIAAAMRPVAEQLGLPAEQLEARLYKLLVYERGGFFLPHRDSEKHDRMVASLIVVLPNRFEGGALVVRHGEAKHTLTFGEAAGGKSPCYAAFYADCEHEVQRVTRGVRLCLAYNLVLTPNRETAVAGRSADVIAESIRSWVASQPAKPLVFAMEHHYTERGLSLDLLKGADRQLADLVVAAAEKTDCVVHLAQVSRHLSQFADDGSFERGYRRDYGAPRRAIKIGETYEDELIGTQWTDAHGKKQPWGDIAFDPAAIVSSTPLDDWKPTSEEFEGYTGNEGNTLDRWYHRSAIVIWHRDQHFDVVASSGATESIPLFVAMAAKLTETPKKRLEQARIDCIRFARAIIARWPQERLVVGHPPTKAQSPQEDFPEPLLTLHDRDTIAMFLTTLALRDQSLPLSAFVVAACREFGWTAFSQELKQMISSRAKIPGRQEIPLRDVEWLAAFCCDPTADPGKSSLGRELCALAAERFCEPLLPKGTYYYSHHDRELSVETSLTLLVKSLAASGHDDGLSQVIRFVQKSPDTFSLDCQVPCLKALIPWSRKQFGSVHPQLTSWLGAVRKTLESATASHPAADRLDSVRGLKLQLQVLAQLATFLADSANEVRRIPAAEDMRQHLIGIMNRHQCDVRYELERKGSPYSLVLTKTSGSFDKAVKRFEANRRLLSALPVAK